MAGQIENRMVADPGWAILEGRHSEGMLPVCGCCEERIMQEKALHILSGRKKIWVCDRCIEDLTEPTGYEGS